MSEAATYKTVRLGVIADHKRKIKSGYEYDRYFPKAKLNDTVINANGNVYKTVEEMERIVKETLDQTAKIAPLLRGNNLLDTCKKVWNFIYNHIQYKLDKEGVEELREPARSWHDRFTGVDCDCMSIFASSILTNLGINHKLRIARYEGTWQHVYVIVPLPDSRQKYYVIDCVLDGFNEQKTFTGKFDHSMKTQTLLGGIPIARLNGIGEATVTYSDDLDRILAGTHFNDWDETVSGIGEATSEENSPMLKHIYDHLVATRDYIRKNPESVTVVGGAKNHLKMYDYAIANFWKGEETRNKALDLLEREEQRWNEVGTMGAVADAEDWDITLLGIDDEFYQDDVDDILDGLGKGILKKAAAAVKNTVKKATTATKTAVQNAGQKTFSAVKTAVQTVQKVNRTIVTKAKEVAKNVGTKVAEAAKKTVAKAKEVAKKAGSVIKKVLVQANPVTLLMRAGFLISMKVNLFGMAERLYPATLSQSEAAAIGINAELWGKSKAGLEKVAKIFENIGGKRSKLEKYIKTGRAAKKLSGVKGFQGLGEPVSTAAAAIAAASTLIAAAAKMKEAGVNKTEYDRLKKAEAAKKATVKGLGEDTPDDGSEVLEEIPATEEGKKGFIPRMIDAIKKFFGKNKDLENENVSDIIAEEESDSTTTDDSGADGSYSDGEDSGEGFFSKAKVFVKENPGIAIGGGVVLVAGLSLLIPPVRKAIFGGSKAKKAAPALSGVGSTKKRKKSSKKRIETTTVKRVTLQ